MWSTAREIAAGDVVIAWMTRDLVQPLVITPGKELNLKYGYYRHDELVGVPYGSKVRSRNGRGFIHLLRPTPELWTLALPHRTQILYLADIAFVSAWLDIRPGSRVIEAGTGSGSFSHSVARTVGPRGHLWSYEFHESRAAKARAESNGPFLPAGTLESGKSPTHIWEEFTRHGMDDIVTLTHRNVCKEGFTVVDTVDAVFLDLPAPWDAVEHAKTTLRKDRAARICCFSPCMEQVLRTVAALNDAGFTGITMYETLLRPHQVDAAPALEPIGAVGARLQRAEARREEKRLRQIAGARLGLQHRAAKRKAGDEDGIGGAAATEEGAGGEGVEGKRARTEEGVSPEDQARDEREAVAEGVLPPTPAPAVEKAAEAAELEAEEETEPRKITLSKTFPDVRGHTSYLTFAVLLPSVAASKSESAAEASTPTTTAEVAPAVEDTDAKMADTSPSQPPAAASASAA